MGYANEDGEPYMTAAELAFEAELDNMAANDYDPYEDDYGYGFEEADYSDFE